MALLSRLPPVGMKLAISLVRWADGWGALPARFVRFDPMFASVFLANLGSVGLDAAFHHLYEYGNIPIFCALGRVREQPSPTVMVRWTLDERVEDGLYATRALERFRQRVEDPDGEGAEP